MKKYYLDFNQPDTLATIYLVEDHKAINFTGRLYGPFLSVAKARSYLTELLDGEIRDCRALKHKIKFTKPTEL
jgi:hypothetical protein